MRVHFLFVLLCCAICAPACRSQSPAQADFATLQANLDSHSTRAAYDSLHFLLTEHYTDLSAAQRKALRKTLERHAIWPFEIMCNDPEPGPKITIAGQVTDVNGKPVPGAKI